MILLTTESLSGYAQFITVLILFVVVLWVTWAVTKWTAGYQKVAKDAVTFLTELDESELMQKKDMAGAKMSFQELLEKVREKKKE